MEECHQSSEEQLRYNNGKCENMLVTQSGIPVNLGIISDALFLVTNNFEK